MKVWHCDASRPVPGVAPGSIECPAPGPGQLLIQVAAVGVTPTELLWYPTTHTQTGEPRLNAVPGHEFSGRVAAAGTGVEAPVGREVFGMNDWFDNGATAEFCVTVATSVAPKPARLTHADAASVPIGALTAWQGLYEKSRLQPGERILIHGGAGAVGVFAIQLARRSGAEVIVTASERHAEVLRELGASDVIDYRTERFEDRVPEVDVVFDTVGGEILARSWGVLKPDGRLVTIAASSESVTDERARQAFFIVEPRGQQLDEIGSLLQSGELRPLVDAIVPFGQTDQAYARQYSPRRGYGKAVIEVRPSI
jgi:NADPH:quinone reductase-like Zn-dependent oxidoreductase